MDAGRDGHVKRNERKKWERKWAWACRACNRVGEEGGLVQQNGRTRRRGGDGVAVGS